MEDGEDAGFFYYDTSAGDNGLGGIDSADCDLGMDVWEDMDCPVLIAGSFVDNSLCNSSQAMSNYRDVASMGDFADEDFIDTGFDSDMGSGAEFEWNTRNDACAWESWSAYENFPPDSARALPAVSVNDVVYYRDDSKCPEGDVCYTGFNSVNCGDRYVAIEVVICN